MGRNIMKKLIVGLLAAFLMSSGLVALTSTSASAACDPANPPYQGCQTASISVSGTALSRVGQRKNYVTAISIDGSNARPSGNVRLVVRGAGRATAGFLATQVKNADQVNAFSLGKRLGKGKYTIQAFFVSDNNTQTNARSSVIGLKNRPRR